MGRKSEKLRKEVRCYEPIVCDRGCRRPRDCCGGWDRGCGDWDRGCGVGYAGWDRGCGVGYGGCGVGYGRRWGCDNYLLGPGARAYLDPVNCGVGCGVGVAPLACGLGVAPLGLGCGNRLFY